MVHFSRAGIAEEVVELRQSLRNIGIAMTIYDIQMFPRVSVEEPQMALLYRWGGTRYGNQGNNRKQDKDANTTVCTSGSSIGRLFS